MESRQFDIEGSLYRFTLSLNSLVGSSLRVQDYERAAQTVVLAQESYFRTLCNLLEQGSISSHQYFKARQAALGPIREINISIISAMDFDSKRKN